jgi:hypothetical protein
MKELFIILALLVSSSTYAQQINKGPVIHSPLDVPLPVGYSLWSYEISILPKGGDLLGPYVVKNNRLSPEASKAMAYSKPGDKIYLENIQAKDQKTGKVIRVENYSTILK